jgi:hypothetical protein
MCTQVQAPALSFGIIADVQYAECATLCLQFCTKLRVQEHFKLTVCPGSAAYRTASRTGAPRGTTGRPSKACSGQCQPGRPPQACILLFTWVRAATAPGHLSCNLVPQPVPCGSLAISRHA